MRVKVNCLAPRARRMYRAPARSSSAALCVRPAPTLARRGRKALRRPARTLACDCGLLRHGEGGVNRRSLRCSGLEARDDKDATVDGDKKVTDRGARQRGDRRRRRRGGEEGVQAGAGNAPLQRRGCCIKPARCASRSSCIHRDAWPCGSANLRDREDCATGTSGSGRAHRRHCEE